MNTATETRNLSEIFDTLKTGDVVTVAFRACMGSSRPEGVQRVVGRRSVSKKYGTTTIALNPLVGKVGSMCRLRLIKHPSGMVVAAHGDMSVTVTRFVKG